jgi:excinuclease UvrABC nuclease subunit
VPTTADLLAAGFTASSAVATALNIDHLDPAGRGPFCRVLVTTTAPNTPGTYAWAVDDEVMYIGKAKELVQIVKGYGMGRAYNDYTYMPASKVLQLSNPRVRVNGLLNAALVAAQTVTWWWVATSTETDALDLEAALMRRWDPPWNRARPRR